MRWHHLHYFFPERHKSQFHKLKMLITKWNANNCDVKKHSESQVCKCNWQAAHKKPDNVHQCRNTPRRSIVLNNFFPERKQGQFGEFQSLQPERNTNDCYHQCKACQYIFEGDKKSAKYYPNYIAECGHNCSPLNLPKADRSSKGDFLSIYQVLYKWNSSRILKHPLADVSENKRISINYSMFSFVLRK